MIVSLIVAYAKNTRAIGKDNKLLWQLKEDLKFFKKTTLGHTLIMGRKTFESIGKPLPQRKTIIITRNSDYTQPECMIANSVEDAISIAENSGETEAFICGGGEIYNQSLHFVQRMYLTEVDTDLEGDVNFAPVDLSTWQNTEQYSFIKDEYNEHSFSINVWEKIT